MTDHVCVCVFTEQMMIVMMDLKVPDRPSPLLHPLHQDHHHLPHLLHHQRGMHLNALSRV